MPDAMARDGYFFHRLGGVSAARGTPGAAILILCLWSSVLVFSGRFEQLITYVIFASWIVYGLTVVSTLINSPRESLMGLVLIFSGLPFYYGWKRRKS